MLLVRILSLFFMDRSSKVHILLLFHIKCFFFLWQICLITYSIALLYFYAGFLSLGQYGRNFKSSFCKTILPGQSTSTYVFFYILNSVSFSGTNLAECIRVCFLKNSAIFLLLVYCTSAGVPLPLLLKLN